MNSGRTIRCILFDLGSTLWTHREDREVLAKSVARARAGGILRGMLGNEVYVGLDDGELGGLLHKAIKKQRNEELRRHPECEPDGVLATQRALPQFGLEDVDRELAGRFFEALRVRIPDSRILFADAFSTLAALKQRGYLLGIVTNRGYGGEPFREDLESMGLLDYFDYAPMAISADLGIRKPDAAIFKHALNGLNVLPEEAAMVGDSLRADVVGAKRLNMLSIWRPKAARLAEGEPPHGEQVPDMEIEQLSQLLELF